MRVFRRSGRVSFEPAYRGRRRRPAMRSPAGLPGNRGEVWARGVIERSLIVSAGAHRGNWPDGVRRVARRDCCSEPGPVSGAARFPGPASSRLGIIRCRDFGTSDLRVPVPRRLHFRGGPVTDSLLGRSARVIAGHWGNTERIVRCTPGDGGGFPSRTSPEGLRGREGYPEEARGGRSFQKLRNRAPGSPRSAERNTPGGAPKAAGPLRKAPTRDPSAFRPRPDVRFLRGYPGRMDYVSALLPPVVMAVLFIALVRVIVKTQGGANKAKEDAAVDAVLAQAETAGQGGSGRSEG